jgi:hypothetical protein
MDILKRIAANREKAGMDRKPEPASEAPHGGGVVIGVPGLQIHKKPSLNQMKAEIISEKPKATKVKEYFEQVIEQCAEDSDNEEVPISGK